MSSPSWVFYPEGVEEGVDQGPKTLFEDYEKFESDLREAFSGRETAFSQDLRDHLYALWCKGRQRSLQETSQDFEARLRALLDPSGLESVTPLSDLVGFPSYKGFSDQTQIKLNGRLQEMGLPGRASPGRSAQVCLDTGALRSEGHDIGLMPTLVVIPVSVKLKRVGSDYYFPSGCAPKHDPGSSPLGQNLHILITVDGDPVLNSSLMWGQFEPDRVSHVSGMAWVEDGSEVVAHYNITKEAF